MTTITLAIIALTIVMLVAGKLDAVARKIKMAEHRTLVRRLAGKKLHVPALSLNEGHFLYATTGGAIACITQQATVSGMVRGATVEEASDEAYNCFARAIMVQDWARYEEVVSPVVAGHSWNCICGECMEVYYLACANWWQAQ